MSLTETFFSSAKTLLFAAENIKQLDEKVRTLTADVASIERRLIRVETYIEMAHQPPSSLPLFLEAKPARKRSPKKS